MITVPEVVEDIVKRSPFLEEGLSLGLINLSALARRIQPEIQEKLWKDIQEGAIVMALKRLSSRLQKRESTITPVLKKITDISVRSNLVEYAFQNSSTLFDRQRQLMTSIEGKSNIFLTMTDGIHETSLFASKSLEKQIEDIFGAEHLRKRIDNLSAITLILPEETIDVPGVYYTILKMLAWEGINFIEAVSSFTELTIIVEDKNVDAAFSVLKKISS